MTGPEVAGLVAVGLLTGVVSGVFGVGGGLILVPAMVLVLGFDQHVAEGTSLLVIIPTALVGAYTHRRHGFVRARTAALLAVGGVVGAVAGSAAAVALAGRTLRLAFVAFLVVVGVRSLVSGLRGDHRPRSSGQSPSRADGRDPAGR